MSLTAVRIKGRKPSSRRANRSVTFVAIVVLAVLTLVLLAWSADPHHRADLAALRDGSLVVLEFGGIVLLLGIVLMLLIWLCQPQTITIREFENSAGAEAFTSSVIAGSLGGELQHIGAIHSGPSDVRRADPAPPSIVRTRRAIVADAAGTPPASAVLKSSSATADRLRELHVIETALAPVAITWAPVATTALVRTIEAVGTVEVAGAKVPLGPALVALKQSWPLRRSGPVIDGWLCRHVDGLRLVVRVQRRGWSPRSFSVPVSTRDASAGFSEAIRTVAIRVVHELSPQAQVVTWSSLCHVTNALEECQAFRATQDPSSLDRAAEHALLIRPEDMCVPGVRALVYNLGIAHLRGHRLARAEDLLTAIRQAAPEDAVSWNALGVTYFEQRRYPEARAAFEQAAKLRPAYSKKIFSEEQFLAQPWNGLGNVYMELHEYTRAIDCYQQATTCQPNAAYPRNGLANAYLEQDQWDDAEREYREAIKLDSAYAYPWHGLGNLRAHQSRFQDAIPFYRKALELDGSLAPAWNGLGDAFSQLNQPDEAVQAHLNAIDLAPDDPYPWHSLGDTYRLQGNYAKALDAICKAIDLNPNASYAWKSLGDVHRLTGSYDEAECAYRKALELNPKDCIGWDALAVTIRAKGQGSMEDEIAPLQRATDANPTEPYGWNQLGDAYYRAGRFAESIAAHSETLKLDPKNSFAWDGIGKARLSLGCYDDAITAHQTALRHNPGDGYALHGIANALFAKGDYEAAARKNLLALKRDPDMVYAWNALGDCYQRLRDYDLAVAQYEEALKRNSQDAYAHGGIARVALERGNCTLALLECRAALELDDRAGYAYITSGDIHSRQLSYAEAVKAYRQALQVEPGSAEAWDGLGRNYVWQGNFANALDVYGQGLDEHPQHTRLLLGEADVLFRKEVARQGDRSFDQVTSRYEQCAKLSESSAIAAHLRLAVIAASVGAADRAKDFARRAREAFDAAWRIRAHPDPDLREFRALALLLEGQPEPALQSLAPAVEAIATIGRFDSERVGVYDLLTEQNTPGFGEYQSMVRSAQSAAGTASDTAP
jgi:tetratricopeptide (TPR) repeat protein